MILRNLYIKCGGGLFMGGGGSLYVYFGFQTLYAINLVFELI